jgi:hypothetical protein
MYIYVYINIHIYIQIYIYIYIYICIYINIGFGYAGETSTVVGVKTKNAIDCGISVMACIGEQLADRQSGATMAVCAEQLEGMIMHYISRFFMSF